VSNFSRFGDSVGGQRAWCFDLMAAAGKAKIGGRREALLSSNHAWDTNP